MATSTQKLLLLLAAAAAVAVLVACTTAEDFHTTLPPPAAYDGCVHTASYRYTPTVNEECKAALGTAPLSRVRNGRYNGCYDPQTDTILLPVDPWPTLVAHETAHACGWRHR